MSKLSEFIGYVNMYREYKIGDIIETMEGYIGDSTSSLRGYNRLLHRAHFIDRGGKGWHSVVADVDNIPTDITIAELNKLAKLDNINMVLRKLKVMRLQKLTKK